MRTAVAFNRIIRRHLRRQAAWLPVLSSFGVGDYGFYEAGVFRQIGNIRDLGIDFDTAAGGTISLDFQTRRDSEVSFFVEGRGQVPQLPDSDIEARIEFAFARRGSFLLKAPTVHSSTMKDIAGVAGKIGALPRGAWRYRYKLVTEVLVAERATMVGTQTRNTTVTISGKANALRRFDLGDVAAELTVKANRSLGLNIVGDGSGPVALGLVKISRRGAPHASLTEAQGSAEVAFETEPTDDDVEPEDDF